MTVMDLAANILIPAASVAVAAYGLEHVRRKNNRITTAEQVTAKVEQAAAEVAQAVSRDASTLAFLQELREGQADALRGARAEIAEFRGQMKEISEQRRADRAAWDAEARTLLAKITALEAELRSLKPNN